MICMMVCFMNLDPKTTKCLVMPALFDPFLVRVGLAMDMENENSVRYHIQYLKTTSRYDSIVGTRYTGIMHRKISFSISEKKYTRGWQGIKGKKHFRFDV